MHSSLVRSPLSATYTANDYDYAYEDGYGTDSALSSARSMPIAVFATDHEPTPLQVLHEFYEANEEALRPQALEVIQKSQDPKTIDEILNGMGEKAQTLVKGLQALGQIHPCIGVAVGAFVLVVTLDMTRRENDRKVLAVKLQIHELMMVFFELRHVRNSHEQGRDGVTLEERLQPLMQTIAHDIKTCASACDAYLKKSFLMKTIKSSVYEGRLSDFVAAFIDHRRKLELAMSLHTSLGVDAANEKLDEQGDRLRVIEQKLDMIAVFRKLDTPREKDVLRFLDSHGGAKACIANDEHLEELVTRAGDNASVSRISRKDSGRRSNDIPELRKRLMKELQEDIDDAFNRNMILFERKLEMQNRQLTEAVQQQSSQIITTLLAGAHDRISDKDLQQIWKDMGWKGSVKARHFVLALHDYYTNQANQRSSPSDRSSLSPLPSPGMPRSPQPSSARSHSSLLQRRRQDDRWALAYINAAYVQPILEAVDDDGTGFVSVMEVNTFVESRPDGWSLPTWIAFWAVGWQASISKYKAKIYELVRTMFEVLEHVLPSNRRAIDEYLFHPSFWRIELLLRSTRSISSTIMSDPDLARVTEAYSSMEEERIEGNLREVGYELDTPATVSLVTGEGRIERYVYPVLYLLLKRHLKVLKLACKHVLDPEELATLNESLVSVLLSVDYRIQNLEAVFKQTHLDVQGRFGNFAFGLLSYGDIKRVPIQNSFGTWVDEDETSAASGTEPLTIAAIKSSLNYISADILKYGIQDAFHATDYYEFEPQRLHGVNPLQGTWVGHCSRREGDETITFLMRLSFRLSPDRKTLLGKGEDYSSAFTFSGTASRIRTGYDFIVEILDDDDGMCRSCSGSLNLSTDTITASWTDRRKKDNPDEVDYQPFTLRRTPPMLYRHRYTASQFVEDPVRARWSFACNAILHEVQAQMWSRRFFEAKFAERKRFVERSTRDLIVSMGLTPQNPLFMAEKQELDYLRRDLDPSEARFYHALAQFEIQKLPWHPAWGCDWCERRITKCRILCIQCMSEDMSDNIDLCGVCTDRMPTKRGFSHDVSHPMIKVEQTLHDFHFLRIVESAKATLGRIKGLFRNVESGMREQEAGGGDHGSLPTPRSSRGMEERANAEDILACACCQQKVKTPCWACVVCVRDTLICHDCDVKRAPAAPSGPSPGHSTSHALVRIRDSSIVGQNATTEEKLAALQQRLVNLEHKVADGLAAIDNKVEEKLSRLEARLEHRLATFEANAELRFDTLEALLRQVAAQTSALPSMYGEVVRDQLRTLGLLKRP
ncbi:hypothetical protein CC1G_02376 [Coprinopsis cinerea okayama7|uniref:Uncharacterized protein n=1 Tax=Coprinopsis cinerea (strain Okayama-7 / 130 / ATCC MYA-4618 / FGSC 9003) TaxID=240176 RepID=A8N7W9_COPC7|nr:hypothetical protein CC1G_02376 [Coprinopsis cinerea okayama7\|eukprot:XP_001830925.2 hypothetical protein CC1G_02376 [Coprinopsis cinerea okayama7\